MVALVDGTSRLEAMSIGDASWDLDFDELNALIQQRNREMPLDQVYAMFRDKHEQTVRRIGTLSDEDLTRPYSYFQPDSTVEAPVMGWLIADTYEHYAEHLPWMRAIAEQPATSGQPPASA
jgi:hypothetical protein